MHFKKSIDDVNVKSSIMTELTGWSDNYDKKSSASLLNVLKKYHKYAGKTSTGDHGEFWMSYCKLVELYLIMYRAVKINETDLYAYSSFELAGLFFIANHLSYTAWMIFYALKLVNLKFDKLEFYNVLYNDGFSIARTEKKRFAELE